MRLPIEGAEQNHWFLQHKSGIRLDLTRMQFDHPLDYSKAIGCGFLTKEPSQAAREIMLGLVWHRDRTAR